MRTICIITGTRAEWGLLTPLAKALQADPAFKLQIIATGAHLSPEFGLTYKAIESDGFIIDKKVEILLSSDTPQSLCKTMGLAQISIAESYEALKPDLIVVLGDRYEIFACVASAMIFRIPVAHLHGGEATEGLIDEAIRHSITKMSHLHFVANAAYAKRVIQLGESPDRVFEVGGFGVDVIHSLCLLEKGALQKELGFTFMEHNFLITFHPVTLENASALEQFGELLSALTSFKETLQADNKTLGLIFTKANADTEGRIINQMIDTFVSRTPHTICFDSMGQLRYLSTMQYVDALVGNSSSGLGEAPSFKIGTINIGDRQKGRIKAQSIIDVSPTKESILQGFATLFSPTFQAKLPATTNPYGNGGAAEKTKEILKTYPLEGILKKSFYDVQYSAPICYNDPLLSAKG